MKNKDSLWPLFTQNKLSWSILSLVTLFIISIPVIYLVPNPFCSGNFCAKDLKNIQSIVQAKLKNSNGNVTPVFDELTANGASCGKFSLIARNRYAATCIFLSKNLPFYTEEIKIFFFKQDDQEIEVEVYRLDRWI